VTNWREIVDYSTLTGLSRDDLRELKGRVEYLLKGDKNVDDCGAQIHRVITDELTARGIYGMPFGVLKKQAYYAAHKEGSASVEEFSKRYMKPPSRVEALKVYRVLVKMLSRRLIAEGTPLSPKTMSQGLKRIPAIVDCQFPGYRESGLLPAIYRSIS